MEIKWQREDEARENGTFKHKRKGRPGPHWRYWSRANPNICYCEYCYGSDNLADDMVVSLRYLYHCLKADLGVLSIGSYTQSRSCISLTIEIHQIRGTYNFIIMHSVTCSDLCTTNRVVPPLVHVSIRDFRRISLNDRRLT